WSLEEHDLATVLRLTGAWNACETGIRSAAEVERILDEAAEKTLRLDTSSLGRWVSALIALVKTLRDSACTRRARAVQIDESGLPDAARRLLALAAAGTTEAASAAESYPSLTTRVGEAYFDAWFKTVGVGALVGETALRGAAATVHRTRTSGVDVMQCVREAGAGALIGGAVWPFFGGQSNV
ncbi:ABC transporter permease, partial [Cupriavidus basilensis]|nr:ABC transporter permease [Cupriavidus basilensis]